jgi:hypothetical protein
MGGGLIQLVAYGAQDIYLTGQPQVTFFKTVYRRYTNFAIESILLVPNDPPNLDTRIIVPITRNADLLKRIWIQVDPNLIYSNNDTSVQLTTISNDFCHSIFKQLEFEIGGQIIDRLYSTWLTVWRDLTEDNPYGGTGGTKPNGSRDLAQCTSGYNRMAYTNSGVAVSVDLTGDNYASFNKANTECYIPLPFWFGKNPGLALPLIALQYHDVNLNITFSAFTNFATVLIQQNDYNQVFKMSQSIKFYGDYVYLDSIERKQFADNSHEYLIEQLQRKTSQNQNNIKLNFINPVKEIVIIGQPNNPYQLKNYSEPNVSTTVNPVNYVVPLTTYGYIYSNTATVQAITQNPDVVISNLKYFNKPYIYASKGYGSPRPIVVSNNKYMYTFGDYNGELNDNISRTNVRLKLVINGKDQFTARNLKYFTRKTVWESHTGIGSGNWGNIAVIPFSLHPEQYQPSGAVNLGILSDVRLIFENFDLSIDEQLNPLEIYALSYNILKISGGMGGVAFS